MLLIVGRAFNLLSIQMLGLLNIVQLNVLSFYVSMSFIFVIIVVEQDLIYCLLLSEPNHCTCAMSLITFYIRDLNVII